MIQKLTGIGVLASGGGSNFEALARACKEGKIPGAKIHLLITNKLGVGALDRAVRLGIDALVLDPHGFPGSHRLLRAGGQRIGTARCRDRLSRGFSA
jgi:folate-dependent phosphoribosylglycinamide formyltransferase PurN